METDIERSSRRKTRLVLRWFLPSAPDTLRGAVALLVALATAPLLSIAELTGIQDSVWCASWLFWAVIGVPIGVALILMVRVLATARRAKWNAYSCFSRCMMLFSLGLFLPMGLATYLNRALDRSPSVRLEMTVTETFVLQLGDRGFYHRAANVPFVAFDAPDWLANWRLVQVYTKQLEPTETFSVEGHRGWLGMPWVDLNSEPRLVRRSSYTRCPAGLVDAVFGKTSIASEYEQWNLLGAKGCFHPNSPNKRQLERWGVPITELEDCPD